MKKMKTIDLVYMAIGTVLITICSWISIPMLVPFTLQTFAVFFLLGLLGGKRTTVSVIIYLLLGAIGVPVFSNFNSGIGAILGTTGGYIVGFILMGILYWLFEKISDKIYIRAAAMAVGLLLCYTFGTAWFMVVYARDSGAIGLGTALGWCVIPFILPDIAKLIVALLLSAKLRKILKIEAK